MTEWLLSRFVEIELSVKNSKRVRKRVEKGELCVVIMGTCAVDYWP